MGDDTASPGGGVFLAFAGDNYYPEGGAQDLVGTADSLDGAIVQLMEARGDWGHVLHVFGGSAAVVFTTDLGG